MDSLSLIQPFIEVLVVPLVLAISGLIWRKVIKPIASMAAGHESMVESIQQIKKELTTNGGSSIKDAINRIESRQLVLEHRTKAIFFDFHEAIFEVDKDGNMLWSNEKFNILCDNQNFTGLDWISIIDEPKRQEFIDELESCSKQNREIKVETQSMGGKSLLFRGFPYRSLNKNHGFLIYLKGE